MASRNSQHGASLKSDKERLVRYWREERIVTHDEIIDAVLDVPRELFIAPEYHESAYQDRALPISASQTISQPTTVVMMLEALAPSRQDTVLEVGTGSGYNAALLGKLARKVVSLERIPALAKEAEIRLNTIGCTNVTVITADGSKAYEPGAPYDKIIVTAAAPDIPPALVAQLREGGIIVIPVGGPRGQRMIRGIKRSGTLATEDLGAFSFVPLKSGLE